ncbi:MAG: tyrosine--tRNA ligase [Chloroflexi bacterium]|nr:tyrosine--tRNA ligase [Chloroflexota bacterium]
MATVETSLEALDTLLNRGVVDAVVRAELERMLQAGKPLRIKFGVDPSRPDLHLGHAVGFRKIRQFQELGHHVIVIIGDWTARIGDPSGRSDTRQMLSKAEVHANAQTYLDQMGKIVDVDKIEVAWQTSWFEDFSLEDVVRLCAKYTVNRMLDRDDFATRYKGGQAVSVVEFLYPLLQAYDSVAIEADVELGGTDQYFNFQVARDIMPAHDLPPQQFLTWPLLVGTDGTRKMSKSYDNYVAITDAPNDMYGKVMSLSDDVMRDYFETLTDIPVGVLDGMFGEMEAERRNPRDVKAELAREIVTQFHDEESADAAEAEFVRMFRQGALPSEIPTIALGDALRQANTIVDALIAANLAQSRSDARRLVQQGGVRLDGDRITDTNTPYTAKPGQIFQVGKRKFGRVRN